MWVLQQLDEQDTGSGTQFPLLHGRSYVIGRKDCDIVLHGDATISRKHAVVDIKTTNLEGAEITIVDKSKVGIHINKSKAQPNKKIKINANDIIQFGKYPVSFILKKVIINAVLSGISSSESKRSFKSLMHRLGGATFKDWNQDATHLVMEKLIFTIKVVCALASAKYIVTPKYFEDLLNSCDKKQGCLLPHERSYLPPIAEHSLSQMLHLFTPDSKRKSLMEGKQLLVLSSSQYKRIRLAFELAGGNVILKTKRDTSTTNSVSSKQTMVLQTEKKDDLSGQSEEKSFKEEVYAKLKSNCLRPIRESEIGLAILHTSLQSFCNPATAAAPRIGTGHSQLLSDTFTIQTQQSQQTHCQQSIQSNESSLSDKKRKATEQNVENSPDIKKLKVTLCSNQSKCLSQSEKPKVINIISFEEDDNSFEEDPFNFNPTAKLQKNLVQNFNLTEKNQNFIKSSEIFDSLIENKKKSKNATMTINESQILNRVIPESELIEKSSIDDILASNTVNIQIEKPSLSFSPYNRTVADTYCSVASSNKRKSSSGGTNHKKAKLVDNFFDFKSEGDFFETPIFIKDDSSGSLNTGVNNVDNPSPTNYKFLKAIDESQGNPIEEEMIISNRKSLELISPNNKSKQSPLSVKDSQNDCFSKGSENDWLSESFLSEDPNCKTVPNISSLSLSQKTRKNHGSVPSQTDLQQTERLFHDEDLISEEFPPVIKKTEAVKGFISCHDKKTVVVKDEEDPDLNGLSHHLIQISFEALVVNSFKQKSYQPLPAPLKKPRNFKVFKKQRFVGWNKPTKDIIGRNELAAFKSDNEQQSMLFDEFKEEADKEEEAEREMNRLFDNWGNDKEPVRKATR